MMNKKAQSQIITTVLIILLVLAAVVIVWQVVQTTVEGGAGDITVASSCMGLNLEIVDLRYTAESGETADILKFKVTRRAGADSAKVTGIKVLIDGISKDISNPITDELGILETSGEISIESVTDVDDTNDFANQKLEIAAILSDDLVCNVGDTVTISEAS